MYSIYCRLNVPIYATPREVIRAAWRRISKGRWRERYWRDARHEFYRAMLSQHASAQHLAATWRM